MPMHPSPSGDTSNAPSFRFCICVSPSRAANPRTWSALQVKGSRCFFKMEHEKTKRESNSITVSRALSIRECAQATGVTSDTLRYYEKIGLLSRVPRERNGHRRFGEAE